jgi:hypothetical protein
MAKMVLAASAELDVLPSVPFLHDTTTKNVIVTPGGSFSGIVDVDELCFGDPRYVVALTLASLMASGGPTRYIDAWMNSADYQNDRIFRLYIGLFIVDFMSSTARNSTATRRLHRWILGIDCSASSRHIYSALIDTVAGECPHMAQGCPLGRCSKVVSYLGYSGCGADTVGKAAIAE